MSSSRFEPGSSRNIISGSCTKDRIKLTLSLCHDESDDTFRDKRASNPNFLASSKRYSRDSAIPENISRRTIFSSTLRYSRKGPSTKWKPHVLILSLSLKDRMRVPLCSLKSHQSTLSKVVFQEPDGPLISINSHWSIEKSICEKIGLSPRKNEISFAVIWAILTLGRSVWISLSKWRKRSNWGSWINNGGENDRWIYPIDDLFLRNWKSWRYLYRIFYE